MEKQHLQMLLLMGIFIKAILSIIKGIAINYIKIVVTDIYMIKKMVGFV